MFGDPCSRFSVEAQRLPVDESGEEADHFGGVGAPHRKRVLQVAAGQHDVVVQGQHRPAGSGRAGG